MLDRIVNSVIYTPFSFHCKLLWGQTLAWDLQAQTGKRLAAASMSKKEHVHCAKHSIATNTVPFSAHSVEVDGEEREKLSTTGFLEREQRRASAGVMKANTCCLGETWRYIKEIRQAEEALQRVISEKVWTLLNEKQSCWTLVEEFSQKELAAKTISLNQLNEQSTAEVRESVVSQAGWA